jgi:hypothetical protein
VKGFHTDQADAEERRMTLQAATEELMRLDISETRQLRALEVALQDNPTLLAIVKRLQRADAVENADHAELFEAVRAG